MHGYNIYTLEWLPCSAFVMWPGSVTIAWALTIALCVSLFCSLYFVIWFGIVTMPWAYHCPLRITSDLCINLLNGNPELDRVVLAFAYWSV